MLGVIAMLEDKSSPQAQVSCRLHQVFLQDFPVPCCFNSTLCPQNSSRACREALPQQHAASYMLYGEDGMFMIMCSL